MLLDQTKCPNEFFIDETKAHGHVAMKCMQCLSTKNDSQIVNKYAAENWVRHLSKSTSKKQLFEVLRGLRHLFISDGITKWIKTSLCKIPRYEIRGLIVRSEEDDLSKIKEWLVKGCEAEMDVKEVQQWSQAIRRDPELLNEYIGKAAANVWLYEDMEMFDEACVAFVLALKYYQQRNSCNNEKITYLSVTRFKGISDWASKLNRKVNERNLGVAYFTLHEWEAC